MEWGTAGPVCSGALVAFTPLLAHTTDDLVIW